MLLRPPYSLGTTRVRTGSRRPRLWGARDRDHHPSGCGLGGNLRRMEKRWWQDGIKARPMSRVAGDLPSPYAGFNMKIPDQVRLDEFLKEFVEFEKNGYAPARPRPDAAAPEPHQWDRAGLSTPRACVADNDLALGRLVEAIRQPLLERIRDFRHRGRCAKRAGPRRRPPHRRPGVSSGRDARRSTARSIRPSTCTARSSRSWARRRRTSLTSRPNLAIFSAFGRNRLPHLDRGTAQRDPP